MQDGRYQLVTAVVQLLLERQRQQCHVGTRASSLAATDAVEKAIADQSKDTCSQEAPKPSQMLPRRPATNAVGDRKLHGSIAKDVGPTKSMPVVPLESRPAEPAREKHPPQRSNAAILQLAHTLIASHASPNREETHTAESSAVPLTKKPAVPRVRRPTSSQPPEGCLDTTSKGAAFDSSSNRDTNPTTTANRPALPARKRPAWAQLAKATPAEQEQALLDWVTSVDDPSLDASDTEQKQEILESPDMPYSAA